jgi:hypothetical protein
MQLQLDPKTNMLRSCASYLISVTPDLMTTTIMHDGSRFCCGFAGESCEARIVWCAYDDQNGFTVGSLEDGKAVYDLTEVDDEGYGFPIRLTLEAFIAGDLSDDDRL